MFVRCPETVAQRLPRVLGAMSVLVALSCSAVLGLDEPTHRTNSSSSPSGGSAGDAAGLNGTVDASTSGAGQGGMSVGAGGTPIDASSGNGGGAGTTAGNQGSSDAARDVVVDVGIDVGPRCDDGKKNGNELGVDCGGNCGVGCPTGSQCMGSKDCLSKNCVGTTCQFAPCIPNNFCTCQPGRPGTGGYRVCAGPVNALVGWDQAKADCEMLGMHLAKIDDMAEANFVATYLDPVMRDYWVGASNAAGMGWQWLDKTSIPETMWIANRAMDPAIHCGALTTSPPSLIPGYCSTMLGYVCEID